MLVLQVIILPARAHPSQQQPHRRPRRTQADPGGREGERAPRFRSGRRATLLPSASHQGGERICIYIYIYIYVYIYIYIRTCHVLSYLKRLTDAAVRGAVCGSARTALRRSSQALPAGPSAPGRHGNYHGRSPT